MGEIHRAKYVGRGPERPCPLGVPLSPNFRVFISKEALLSFWGFMEASLHRYDRLNQWPLAIEHNLQLLFPQQRRWGWEGLKVPTL